jgi:hypothetical protein
MGGRDSIQSETALAVAKCGSLIARKRFSRDLQGEVELQTVQDQDLRLPGRHLPGAPVPLKQKALAGVGKGFV